MIFDAYGRIDFAKLCGKWKYLCDLVFIESVDFLYHQWEDIHWRTSFVDNQSQNFRDDSKASHLKNDS